WVKGPKAIEFLQTISSNDVSKLVDGQVQYACFPNEKGGIKDDFLTYRVDGETFLLVVNAGNIEKDWAWVTAQGKKFGLEAGREIYDASGEMGQVAVQGPLAMKVVQKLTDSPVEELGFYTFKKADVAGIKDAIVSITGYTGAGGCEIYVANGDLPRLWDALMEAGEEFGIMPAGLGARDTLRLEMGFCLYGHDIEEDTCPIEAGLGWITKLTEDKKGLIGREVIERMKADKPARRLVGFEMLERGIPRQHYRIVDAEGQAIGEVTSGTMSPMMKRGIGMGYVQSAFAKAGTEIYIEVRGKKLKAVTVKLPIYKAS
ncbi:MAG: glycine cleavage system protein T, partial [Bacteroidetes bacterium]